MVRVSWEANTGELISVKKGDGPGQYSDTADPKAVKEHLSELGKVTEFNIATAVMKVYNGSINKKKSVVTTESYPESPDVTTTVAFIEPSGLSSKLECVTCNNCGFSPQSMEEWYSESRKENNLDYTDWFCPKCKSIIHVEAK